MNYFLILLLGYLIGSIPTAFIVLKYSRNVDITKIGSGNVGAMNSFFVSNSRKIGLFVFTLDFFKGALALIVTAFIFGYQFEYLALSLFSAVCGHCFSVWIKFRGGKGLATAAGGSIIFIPSLLFVWVFCWLISFAIKREINLSNIVASLLSIILFISFAEELNEFSHTKAVTNDQFIIGCTSILVIILIKHYNNVLDYFRSS